MRFLTSFLFIILSSLSADEIPRDSKIYVPGHTGLVGKALIRKLENQGYTNIVKRTSRELDLRDQTSVRLFFEVERPDYVFLAAAKVGGIKANLDYPASAIYDNLQIQLNIIHSAYEFGVSKLLFLGSSCIYPRSCPQPILESYLLTGPLEKTNEPYAIAKIAGINLCQSYNREYGTNFITCMPTNLYGPDDNFDKDTSHVLPALLGKIVTATRNSYPTVEVWGTGTALREFLFVDDLADACLFLMNNYSGNDPINIGTGTDITIKELACMLKAQIGYEGDFVFNTDLPDGTPRKLLDVSKLSQLGWVSKTPLEDGLSKTIEWYNTHY